MKIGLAYDLKESLPLLGEAPDDALEEYDTVETVEAISTSLSQMSHSVVRLGGGLDLVATLVREKVDFVFNIAEGRGTYRSREAQVPSVLEMMDVPYSGSDPVCLGICLDKALTKRLVAAAGVPTPRWVVVRDKKQLATADWTDFPLPAFVKPAHEGSSKGVRMASRVETPDKLREIATTILTQYGEPALVEEFIAGDEVTVGLVGNSPPQVVGIMRILPKAKTESFVYSLEVKRQWESLVHYECPARLDAKILERIKSLCMVAFETLGCRDLSRLDFRIDGNGTPYLLEINPLPGLNSRSGDLPIMAGHMGWSYDRLISSIMGAALSRYPQCVSR